MSLKRITRLLKLRQVLQTDNGQNADGRARGLSVGDAWNLMPLEGPESHLTVRVSALVAQNVADVTWHKTQRLEFRHDGSLVFHVDVSGLCEIVWWILGYGDQAQVLRPAKLRHLVAQRAANMLRIYED